jgi:hypothetical protein
MNSPDEKIVTAAKTPEVQGPIESAPSAPSTPIRVKLILSTAPRLNEQAELTVIITSTQNAPQTRVTITLPADTNLIDGNLEWVGDLVMNKPQTLTAKLRFTTEGNKTIEAKALCDVGEGAVWGDAAYIYLYTSKDVSHSGFSPQPQITTGQKSTPPSTTPNP